MLVRLSVNWIFFLCSRRNLKKIGSLSLSPKKAATNTADSFWKMPWFWFPRKKRQIEKMTKYGALLVFPANDSVRQAMLCIQDNEEHIIPDLTTVVKKELGLDEETPQKETVEKTPVSITTVVKEEFQRELQSAYRGENYACEESARIPTIGNHVTSSDKRLFNIKKEMPVSLVVRNQEIVNVLQVADNIPNRPDQIGDPKRNRRIKQINLLQDENFQDNLSANNGNNNNKSRCKNKNAKVVTVNHHGRKVGKIVRCGNGKRIATTEKTISAACLQLTEPEKNKVTDKTIPDPADKTQGLSPDQILKESPIIGNSFENVIEVRQMDNVIQIEVPSMLCLHKDFSLREDSSSWSALDLKPKLFTCDVCGKQFHSSETYRKHIRIHTSGKPHRCNVCHKTFSLLSYLKRHRSIHVSESKKLLCQYCFKKYPDAHRLRMHQSLVHLSEDRKHKCDICSKCFKLPGALKVHKKIHLSEKEYACEICKLHFSNSSNLLHHYKTHTGERPFNCTFCNKSFTRQRHLTSHYFTHTDEKPFKCQLCGKTFRTPSNLKQHEGMHSGKKFACDICGKSYSRPAYVRLHIARAHTKVKSHSCEMCSETFFTTSELMIHIRAHISEKPFKCKFCPKTFVTGSRRDQHSIVHTNFKPFQCDKCALSYYSHKSLKVHFETHHKEEIKI